MPVGQGRTVPQETFGKATLDRSLIDDDVLDQSCILNPQTAEAETAKHPVQLRGLVWEERISTSRVLFIVSYRLMAPDWF